MLGSSVKCAGSALPPDENVTDQFGTRTQRTESLDDMRPDEPRIELDKGSGVWRNVPE
jgi:hypothetical protein